MKKAYSTPKLTSHGDINVITNFTGLGNRRDTLFGPPGGSLPVSDGVGSDFDSCLIKPGTKVCL